jgi:hypothetical protein
MLVIDPLNAFLAGCGKTTVRPRMLSRFHDWCG